MCVKKITSINLLLHYLYVRFGNIPDAKEQEWDNNNHKFTNNGFIKCYLKIFQSQLKLQK